MRPSEFLNMDDNEKAFVIACIKTKIESDKKEEKKLKKKAKKANRKR